MDNEKIDQVVEANVVKEEVVEEPKAAVNYDEQMLKIMKKTLFQQKLQTLAIVVFVVLVVIAGLYAKKQVDFMAKQLVEVKNKIDTVDVEKINSIITGTEAIVVKTDATVDQVGEVIVGLDAAVDQTNELMDQLDDVADTLSNVADQLEVVGNLFRF